MRTLSTELTNAQEADAATPHIEVILKSRSGATTRTYKTDDATNRITRIRTAEGMYGGTIFETRTPDGKTVPIAGQILFNNSDNEFSGLDLRGYKCQVRWGFASYVSGGSTTAISGTKYSEGEPYFVYNHREISSPGVNHTELWLISIWAYMGLQGMFGESFTNKFSSSGNKIRHVLMDTLTRKPDKVFVYDTSASLYRDHTTAALDNTTNFEFLLGGAAPGAAGDVVGDILYIGLPNDNYSEADRITFELARVGAGTWTFAYEFWNGSAWITLSSIDDQTVRFTDGTETGGALAPKVLSFALPAQSTGYAVNGQTKKWIRIRVTACSSVTTTPQILRIGVQMHWGMQINDTDGLENSAVLAGGEFEATINDSRRDILRLMLDRTQLKPIFKRDYLVLDEFDESPSGQDYSYVLSGGHSFFSDIKEQALVIPNRVIAIAHSDEHTSGRPNYLQSVDDSNSRDAFGASTLIIVDPSITSAADSDAASLARATRRLTRAQTEAYQGEISVPMNIGQEPWDYVKVTDVRLASSGAGEVHKGFVGRLIRDYNQPLGLYRCSLTLGMNRQLPTPFDPYESLALGLNEWGIDLAEGIGQALLDETLETDPARRGRVGGQEVPGVREGIPGRDEGDVVGEDLESPDALIDPVIAEITGSEAARAAEAAIAANVTDVTANPPAALDPGMLEGESPGVFRHGFAMPNVRSVTDFSRLISSLPEMLTGAVSSLPQSDGYSDSKSNSERETVSSFENELVVHTLYLRDSIGGGYSSVVTFNDGTGNVALDGSLTGTNVTVLKAKMDIVPAANTTYDLGSASLAWDKVYVEDLYTENIRGRGAAHTRLYDNLLAGTADTYSIGTTGNEFLSAFINNVYVETLRSQAAVSVITVYDDLIPDTADTYDLGSASSPWQTFYGQYVVLKNYIELLEISDPSAPSSNLGRLYVKDNGAGKTQLVVRFPTGAVQVIATEP